MKKVMLLMAILLLQACATSGTNTDGPAMSPQPRAMSPSERISAGSGAMHSGMAGY